MEWRGVHVRVNEKSFLQELVSEHGALTIAYAVTEYVLRSVRDRLERIARESGVKVENVVDAKRVFTTPLSLHRSRDAVAVCFKPDALTSFNPSWTTPGSFKHDPTAWRSFDPGEADNLAVEALKNIKGLKTFHSRIKAGWEKHRVAGKNVEAGREPGRFQVMSLLQAARHFLHGDIEKPKSFGLNRAIFYAWAKHYGRGYVSSKPPHQTPGLTGKVSKTSVQELGEEAYVSPRGFYIIGDREQTPSDYDRNIALKIESIIPYELAWEAALKYLSRFPRDVLKDPVKFYERAYEPVRDRFVELVVKKLADEEPFGEEAGKGRAEPSRIPRQPAITHETGLLKWLRKPGYIGEG
uniref:Uncharacterized protein n=1 Tax=Thermosphaera aggregans TaxID=54254 RepID=A0A7C2FXT3_9CREN